MSNHLVPDELQQTLAELRARIRRYVLIEGVASTVAVLGGVFWLSLIVDHLWFRVSRLELPYWFRAAFDVGVAGLFGFLLVSLIGLRVLRGFRSKALALVLERRFPELNDRLVTAVELAENGDDSAKNPLAAAMLRQTVADAVEATRKLDLTSVFDRKPLQRAVTAAAVLIASIGGLAVASNSTIQTWKSSFLDLNDEYWNREYGLTVRVVAHPGDLIREFDDQFIKHPRGADLTLLMEVDEGRKVPERVQLSYRLSNGRGGGTVLCSKIGERQFRHSLSGLLDDVEFHIYGGDFVNREPYRVQIVEPPQVDRIDLACFYPAYTGMKAPDSTPEKPLRDVVPVRGTQIELPNETEFLLLMTTSKPYVHIRMQFGSHDLILRRQDGNDFAEYIRRNEEDVVTSIRRIDTEIAENWLCSRLVTIVNAADQTLAPRLGEVLAELAGRLQELRNIRDENDKTQTSLQERMSRSESALRRSVATLVRVAEETADIEKRVLDLRSSGGWESELSEWQLERLEEHILGALHTVNGVIGPVSGGATENQHRIESWLGIEVELPSAKWDSFQINEQLNGAIRRLDNVMRHVDNVVKEIDGRRLFIPFVLSSADSESARMRIESLKSELGPPFVIAPESNLRIHFEDDDGILTAEPARVTISGIVDKAPVVETRLRGIGTSITGKATIPVLGRIVDDYGLADVWFQFRVNDQEDWTRRDLKNGVKQAGEEPGDVVREFTLHGNKKEDEEEKEEKCERFDVVPLGLSLNQQLTLTVVAEDCDNLNGPHVTLGERYSFKVVSNEELTSLLYQRELNLRSQFERVIVETKDTQQDLIRHRARVAERKRLNEEIADKATPPEASDEAKKKLAEINLAVTACAERSLHQVRKNANETASVEQAFRDIREELVNNKLHTPQTLERIDDRIVKPLQSISSSDYPSVDESLGLFRLANERGNDPTATIDQSVELLSGMVARMEAVLAEMEKLKDFRKLGEELKELIEAQEGLLDRTKKEQKKQFLKKNLGF